jgi:hypothetical protein
MWGGGGGGGGASLPVPCTLFFVISIDFCFGMLSVPADTFYRLCLVSPQ